MLGQRIGIRFFTGYNTVMNRGLKQFIYGAGFLLFFSAVAFGVYVLVFRSAPSCFDVRQNGKEMGIDCGGPCAPCEQKYALSIEVSGVTQFGSGGKTVVVVAMHNPNDDYGFKDVTYRLKGLAMDGSVVASVSGHAFIYDRKTKGNRYLVDTLEASSDSITKVVVEFSNPQVVAREELVEPDVNIMRYVTDIAGLGRVTEPVFVFTKEINTTTIGNEVKQLEDFLYQKQFLKKLPDGTFDADTRTALVAYQKARSIIPASGLFGPLTRAKVNAEVDRITRLVVEPRGSVAVSGAIKNNDLVASAKTVVTALLYDASGIWLGGSKTELENVQATEERVFKVVFPETVPVDRIDETKTRVFVDSIK